MNDVDLFALLGPVFALPAAFGGYLLLRSTHRSAAQLGVALWHFGMVLLVCIAALGFVMPREANGPARAAHAVA